MENLVLSLMQGNHNVSPRNSSSAGDENSPNAEDEYGEAEGDGDDAMNEYAEELEDDVDEVRNALGIMKIHQGSSFYRGETHWAVVLSEVFKPASSLPALAGIRKCPSSGLQMG